jgi:hypothetical protein
MPTRVVNALLVLLLLAAAALRFVGIDRDLRRGSPTPDEWENFVGPVAQMWRAGSLDPNVHGGYPGLFNFVALLPMGLGLRLQGETGACIAGRLLVAAFGTLNVLLLFLMVRPVWGAGAALLGAALLAFSRSEVSEAHFITPDVLVVTAFLALALAAGRRPPGSAWPGVWAGLGTAIKYSGVLLFAAVAADLAARRRLRRLVPVLALGVLTFALAAPFALRWRRDQQRGIAEFVSYYFAPLMGGSLAANAVRQLAEVFSWMGTNLGPLAAALALLAALARPRRPLAAPAAVVVASLAVLALAGQVYARHVLLASAGATVLAAAGFSVVQARVSRPVAAALAAAAVALPLWRGAAVAWGYAQPPELERAAAWIEGQDRPLRIATSLDRLRLDGPFEVRVSVPLWDLPPETFAHYDLVVAPRAVARRLTGVAERQAFGHRGDPEGAVVVMAAGPSQDVPWPAPVSSGGTAPAAGHAWDGRAETAWVAPPGAGWVEAQWEAVRPLHALEITVPAGEGYWPQRLRVSGRQGSGAWAPLDAIALRPSRTRLQQPPHGQVLVLREPLAADALRIERREGSAWGLLDVRAFSAAGGTR